MVGNDDIKFKWTHVRTYKTPWPIWPQTEDTQYSNLFLNNVITLKGLIDSDGLFISSHRFMVAV